MVSEGVSQTCSSHMASECQQPRQCMSVAKIPRNTRKVTPSALSKLLVSPGNEEVRAKRNQDQDGDQGTFCLHQVGSSGQGTTWRQGRREP